jgi:hypothetical protein
MSRPEKGGTATSRKRSGPKRTLRAKPFAGSDGKPVSTPRNGYAHIGKLERTDRGAAETDPETGVNLRGVFESGKTPPDVAHGRRRVVLAMMMGGVPVSDIVRQCEDRYLMSATQTRFFVHEIQSAWRKDSEEGASYARAEAIVRLRRDLGLMRAQREKKWRDINSHESLLSKIEGTMAPIRVSVLDANEAVRDALTQVLGSMSEDDLEAFLTEGEEVFQVLAAAE